MEITINVPDELVERVETAYSVVYGYQDQVTVDDKEVTNPQSKTDFLKEKLIGELKGIVLRYETDQARKTVEDAIKSELIIT